jgi:hypothetical protein
LFFHTAVGYSHDRSKTSTFSENYFSRGLTIVLMMTATTSKAAERVTFESLLNEMIDQGSIATCPDPYYTCWQSSSYDHKADDP